MQKNNCYNTFVFYQNCIIIDLGWIARVAVMVFGEGGAGTQKVVRDLYYEFIHTLHAQAKY